MRMEGKKKVPRHCGRTPQYREGKRGEGDTFPNLRAESIQHTPHCLIRDLPHLHSALLGIWDAWQWEDGQICKIQGQQAAVKAGGQMQKWSGAWRLLRHPGCTEGSKQNLGMKKIYQKTRVKKLPRVLGTRARTWVASTFEDDASFLSLVNSQIFSLSPCFSRTATILCWDSLERRTFNSEVSWFTSCGSGTREISGGVVKARSEAGRDSSPTFSISRSTN